MLVSNSMLYNEINNYQEKIFAFIFIFIYTDILLVNKLSSLFLIKIHQLKMNNSNNH